MKAIKTGFFKISVIFFILSVLFCVSGCGARSEFPAEIAVIAELEGEKDVESIAVFDKYEISDGEYYYYLRWYDAEGDESEILMIYDKSDKSAKAVEFSGMTDEIRTKWDEVKNARPDKSFSPSEIEEIRSAE